MNNRLPQPATAGPLLMTEIAFAIAVAYRSAPKPTAAQVPGHFRMARRSAGMPPL